ncbi:MAG TPA: XRE family transcriptional regulator [Candidatus Micrarchaeaceae archaeon]|nr:XRE family transcriptional regulator [Candidatus Micrarchaeaceae archaeon]
MSQTVDPGVLAQRLRDARKQAGFTQEAVADELGIPRTSVVAMERNDRRVQPAELVRLAELYGRQLHELVRPSMGVQDFSAQFRVALQRAPDSEALDRVVRELQELTEDYLALERVSGSVLPRHYPSPYPIDTSRPEQSAEDIATRERGRLGLGDGPLLQLREVLESDVGLRTFSMKMPSSAAALFAYSDDAGGCLAFNSEQPFERQRMSIAHEYAHFLTRRHRPEITVLPTYRRVPAEERAANAFAASFLMPASGLVRRFNDLSAARGGLPTPSDVLRLANLYQVSFQAVMVRLEDLKLLPSGKWDQLEVSGFRVQEAKDLIGLPHVPSDNDLFPVRYRYLAVEAFEKGSITEGQLSRYLRVDRLTARSLAGQAISEWAGAVAVDRPR